jgi:hypothetical protein
MPANKKPRKKYKPRPALLRPITYALPKEAMTNLQLPPHVILDAFMRGQGDEPGWHTLTCALNLGAVLSRAQPAEAQAVMSRALDAIVEVKKRGIETGNWGMSGDQYRDIGAALSLSNDMQEASTRREVRDALRIVMRDAT